MPRPAHIAPLDAALKEHLAQLAEAEQRQVEIHAAFAEFLARHAVEAEAIEQAKADRRDAYYAAKSCEGAIRKLGYVVLGAPGDTSHLDAHDGNFRVPIVPADRREDEK